MTAELDKKLCKAYPLLYRNRHGDPKETAMCWGFDCGDGWYELIDEASAKLEPEIAKLPEGSRPCASQVKEKFGGLRIYLTSYTDAMGDIIEAACIRASKTCEECGKPGRIETVRGWRSCFCPEHLTAALEEGMPRHA